MGFKLQIFLVICSFLFTGIIFTMLKKEIIDLKYSMIWVFSCLVFILISLKPNIVNKIAILIGIVEPVNALFLLGIFFLLLIILSLTIVVSRLSNRIRKLAQKIALLEEQIKFHETSNEKRLNKNL